MKILTHDFTLKPIMKYLIITLFCIKASLAFASDVEAPVATDTRIKTFVHSENEVFPIILQSGYQTAIEFSKDETIQTYSVGNQFVWKFSAVGRTLFITPLEDNISTNMTVLTNKRRYYFDLRSRSASLVNDEELCYVVRFFFPDEPGSSAKIAKIDTKKVEEVAKIQTYNFNYHLKGNEGKELSVFDNGVSTFFKFDLKELPKIKKILFDGKEVRLDDLKYLGKYCVYNRICEGTIQIFFNGKSITIKRQK